MDGYAVRAADVANIPARLKWSARCPPANPIDRTLGPGETVRIFTGAPLPAGADAIVIQEDTDRDGDIVDRQGIAARSAAMSATPASISARAMSGSRRDGG